MEKKGVISDRCEINRHIGMGKYSMGKPGELEELKSEKEMLFRSLDCADDAGISTVKKEIAAMEGALQKLSGQEAKYSAELDKALKQYAELKERVSDMDAAELMDARLAVRERLWQKQQAKTQRKRKLKRYEQER